MANLSPQGPFRAFDANGSPLSGGKLYTYEAGTSDNKNTYTDDSEATANANPVVLDSDGYANVWLGDGAYKLVLKDENDATIWTIDNVSGSASGAFGDTVTSLAANTAITSAYENNLILTTSSPTLSLLAAATAGEGFTFAVRNTDSGSTTLDPNGAETIGGASTLVLAEDEWAQVFSDGTNWQILDNKPLPRSIGEPQVKTTLLNAFTAKTTLADADQLVLADSEASNVNKKITWANAYEAIRTVIGIASDSVTGFVEKATQAEMEAETADKYPDAELMKYHPGVAKFWIMLDDSSGTPSILASHNVTSVTDDGPGIGQLNLSITFSSANYALASMCSDETGSSNDCIVCLKEDDKPTATTVPYQTTNAGGAIGDIPLISITGFGDL